MSRSQAFLGWLEDRSDWLSPIVVKEVRQVVRGREFASSFGASLIGGLGVAFFGAADALTGGGTSGQWTFVALMSCLGILGLAIVPLGAFNALRNERLEQTFDLITLTALSPRRVVIGKLLAQGVKLATLFAAMAPFIAMSFLLGGIDFVTILVALLMLFLWSLWACALCLFLSTLLKSRAMSGLVLGAVAIALFLAFVLARSLFFAPGFRSGAVVFGATGSPTWWVLPMAATFLLATLVNLILLAENRLSLPTENRVTTLRVGFLAQFLLIVAWTLSSIDEPLRVRETAVQVFGVIGGLHLALVAMFTVTEDLVVPRRVLLRMTPSSTWRRPLAIFLPGGGRGAVYVLAQMALMLVAAWMLDATAIQLRWLLAMCGYICFFTGVPAVVLRLLSPERASSLQLRIAVLLLLTASTLLPDMIHYVLWQPDVLSLSYSARHLLNPIRTLANWLAVETHYWFAIPTGLGLTGFVAYLVLIQMTRATVQPAPIDPYGSAAATGEPDRADVAY
jgi:hypothetical protein